MRKTINTLVSLAVGALIGAGLTLGLAPAETRTEYVPVSVPVEPAHCPEEDSCRVDYDGQVDRWVITPVVP